MRARLAGTGLGGWLGPASTAALAVVLACPSGWVRGLFGGVGSSRAGLGGDGQMGFCGKPGAGAGSGLDSMLSMTSSISLAISLAGEVLEGTTRMEGRSGMELIILFNFSLLCEASSSRSSR